MMMGLDSAKITAHRPISDVHSTVNPWRQLKSAILKATGVPSA
jgi:hypothetical protein